jgi:hypothetical protein
MKWGAVTGSGHKNASEDDTNCDLADLWNCQTFLFHNSPSLIYYEAVKTSGAPTLR